MFGKKIGVLTLMTVLTFATVVQPKPARAASAPAEVNLHAAEVCKGTLAASANGRNCLAFDPNSQAYAFCAGPSWFAGHGADAAVMSCAGLSGEAAVVCEGLRTMSAIGRHVEDGRRIDCTWGSPEEIAVCKGVFAAMQPKNCATLSADRLASWYADAYAVCVGTYWAIIKRHCSNQ